MALLPPLTKLITKDPVLDRVQDRIYSVLNQQSQTQLNWVSVGQSGGPPFQNSWTNLDAPGTSTARVCQFTIDALGFVVVRGLVQGGTPPSTIFTLPAGYRPGRLMTWATDSNGAYGSCQAFTDGSVKCASGSPAWCYLDVIRFLAEN